MGMLSGKMEGGLRMWQDSKMDCFSVVKARSLLREEEKARMLDSLSAPKEVKTSFPMGGGDGSLGGTFVGCKIQVDAFR